MNLLKQLNQLLSQPFYAVIVGPAFIALVTLLIQAATAQGQPSAPPNVTITTVHIVVNGGTAICNLPAGSKVSTSSLTTKPLAKALQTKARPKASR